MKRVAVVLRAFKCEIPDNSYAGVKNQMAIIKGHDKNSALHKATIIAFVLIPVLAVVRLIYHAPRLDYGHRELTVNSVFLLAFGIYAFFLSSIRFFQCQNSWEMGKAEWRRQLGFTYIFVVVCALSLPFLMMFEGGYKGVGAFCIEGFMAGLVFASPAFLFPIGIVLFFLALPGVSYFKVRPKSYLIIIFSTSVLFVLGGAASAALVFVWWAGGGISIS